MGLNKSSIKSIDFQLENINNLPIDGRYLRYFKFEDSVPDSDYDFEGQLIYNTYNKSLYLVEKNNTGNLVYKLLSNKFSNDNTLILNIPDEDYTKIDTELNKLNSKPIFIYVSPMNVIYFRYDVDSYKIISDTCLEFDNISKISTLPSKFRDNKNYLTFRDKSTNKRLIFDYNNSKTYNLVRIESNLLNSLPNDDIIHNQLYIDEETNNTYLGLNDGVTKKLVQFKNTIKEFKTILILNTGINPVTHNLNSTYVRIFLRYIYFNKNVELELNENDFNIIDKNNVELISNFPININNVELKIITSYE